MNDDSGLAPPALKDMQTTSRRWRAFAWTALALVAFISLAPLESPPQAPSGTDKLVHIGLYATLMYCHARAWPQRRWLRIAVALASYGVVLEWLQQFMPLRSTSFADALANCAGVSIMLLHLTARRRRCRATDQPRP